MKMKKYLADTNLYLRYILQDNKKQADRTQKCLEEARQKKIKIIYCSEVILEMEFVLRSVYSLERQEIVKYLSNLISTSYLEISDRDIWTNVFKIYTKTIVSLFDVFLFFKAEKEEAEILSFDSDFKKLKKLELD